MKKWINKQTIVAFILGAVIFTGIPISAAITEYICYKVDYRVLVNGVEYSNEDLPVLNYKGNTYAPFRSILEAAGLEVKWNADLQQASVINPALSATPKSKPEPKPATDTKLEVEQEPEQEQQQPPEESELEPEVEQEPEPAQEPAVQNNIGEVFVIMDGDRKIVIHYPEFMDIASATDLSNYAVYEADGVTLTSVQPNSAEYINSGGGLGVCRVILHIDELPPGIMTYSDGMDRYSLWISPTIKNADGTKQVNNLESNNYLTNGKILFAYPYTDTLLPDGTTVRRRGSH